MHVLTINFMILVARPDKILAPLLSRSHTWKGIQLSYTRHKYDTGEKKKNLGHLLLLIMHFHPSTWDQEPHTIFSTLDPLLSIIQ